MVRDEKWQGVMESGGGQSARVPFGVTVTEDKGGVDRCGRQAEKGRHAIKDIVVRGGLRGEKRETTSVRGRVGLSNMGGKRVGSGSRGKPLRVFNTAYRAFEKAPLAGSDWSHGKPLGLEMVT